MSEKFLANQDLTPMLTNQDLSSMLAILALCLLDAFVAQQQLTPFSRICLLHQIKSSNLFQIESSTVKLSVIV